MLLTACTAAQIEGKPGKLSRSPLTVSTTEYFNPVKLNKIALLPIENGSWNTDFDQEIRSSLTGELLKALRTNTSLTVKSVDAGKGEGRPQIDKAKALARGGEFQGILYGVVVDDTGEGNLSSKRKENQSVRIQLWLLDSASKKVVWNAQFQKKNRPFTDNLFQAKERLRSGLNYQSSLEILREGFTSAARKLEKQRQEIRIN